MEGLLSANIKNILEDVIAHCFYINRIADRMVSFINVKFAMNSTAEILHQKYAHWAPLYADLISEYMESRNCTTIYKETPIGDQVYENPTECFNKALDMNVELEILIKKAIMIAKEENDYTTMAFLENALLKVVSKTSSLLLLVDKIDFYGDTPKDWMKFDHDIKDFGIFGE